MKQSLGGGGGFLYFGGLRNVSYLYVTNEVMECLNCKIKFEPKKSFAKFCSTNCRVKWNRKQPKKDVISKTQLQVLYNSILEAVGNINVKNGLPQPIGAVFSNQSKNEPNNTAKVQVPLMSFFEVYKSELEFATNIEEIQATIKSAKGESDLSIQEKIKLESYAKELSKEMYTD